MSYFISKKISIGIFQGLQQGSQNCLEVSRFQVLCKMLTPVAFTFLTLLSCQWTPGGFICNLCNTSCFSGFTDQACEPLKIMSVIPTIDSALGANWIKQHNENWVLYPFSEVPFAVCCVSRQLPWEAASGRNLWPVSVLGNMKSKPCCFGFECLGEWIFSWWSKSRVCGSQMPVCL